MVTVGNQAGGAHPIEGLMKTAMQSLEGIVDVNTVVGDAIEAKDGTVIVPVSQVSLGFAAGGSEFGGKGTGIDALPFGGGSGAGVSVKPVAFLVVQSGGVRLLPVEQHSAIDRLIDLAPEVLDRLLQVVGLPGQEHSEGLGEAVESDPGPVFSAGEDGVRS